MRTILSTVALVAAMGLNSSALALSSGQPAGTAVGVDPQATAQLDGNTTALVTGADLFMGQRVITGNAGQVQIVFSDDTHLVVGPGSTVVIAEYLMRNDTTASSVVVNALSGTFRFITGNSPKNAYQIQTPTGTIGIRGTAFDLVFDPESNETHVLLYHGGLRMCPDVGACFFLSDSCGVGVMPQHEDASEIGHADKRRRPLLGEFNYLASQQPLDSEFRINGSGKCKVVDVAENGPTRPRPQPDPLGPPPPPSPPPADDSGHDNKGFGNGGDTTGEAPGETGNPGKHLGQLDGKGGNG
jgi:hypothetical protein